MTAFETAKKFFDACESAKGWTGCGRYVADDATFVAQASAMTGIDTVEAYCEWNVGFAVTAPGASWDVHASAFDESTRTAIFFATYHAKHTGEGGPVPPTQKETNTHYVYALVMDDDDKVQRMTKIWNSSWAFREFGWAD